jgi:hypothetical protein
VNPLAAIGALMKITLVKSGTVYRVKGKPPARELPESITFDLPVRKGSATIDIWSPIATPELGAKLEAFLKRKA